jgi:hypothetical protein
MAEDECGDFFAADNNDPLTMHAAAIFSSMQINSPDQNRVCSR